MPIKFLLLGGGGLGFFRRGGGSANFIFMGVGIFPIKVVNEAADHMHHCHKFFAARWSGCRRIHQALSCFATSGFECCSRRGLRLLMADAPP